MDPENSLDAVVTYYDESGLEEPRLANDVGQIEFARTQQIIRQYLVPPPAVILDVGGAAGRYACWLAQRGYQVHLIDPVPLHVEQAQAASGRQPDHPIASCTLGDARQLDVEDNTADAILLLGPLYHLLDIQDRMQALSECYRTLKPGGSLFAAGISRFASIIDGFQTGNFTDPDFSEIMKRDLETGQHRNPTGNPAYFTDAYFHHPEELKSEVRMAGFEGETVLAVESISYMVKNLADNWADANRRAFILEIISKLEHEPSLIGASLHIMCVALKK